MKDVIILMIYSILIMVAVYNYKIKTEKIIDDQQRIIIEMAIELENYRNSDLEFYREQIERWVVPYERLITGKMIKRNPTLKQKDGRGHYGVY